MSGKAPELSRRRTVSLLWCLLAAVLGAFGCRQEWRRADDFEARLTCGIRLTDVRAVARELGAERMGRPTAKVKERSDIPDYYVASGTTLFSLWTRNDQVVAYIRNDDVGDSEKHTSSRVELCTVAGQYRDVDGRRLTATASRGGKQ